MNNISTTENRQQAITKFTNHIQCYRLQFYKIKNFKEQNGKKTMCRFSAQVWIISILNPSISRLDTCPLNV